jgi:hypothetical protein
MSITPCVPHDDLVVSHEVDDHYWKPEGTAAYVARLQYPPGFVPEPPDVEEQAAAPPIVFHKGSPEKDWHGWTTAHVIAALIKHMEYHQSTPFACEQNEEILAHLRAAHDATKKRAAERKGRGVLYDHKTP